MTLNFNTYKDKVLGCFTGKNVGGTLGAPFECMRGFFDVEFYTQDLSNGPPPNDDLDLQIVWLSAVERHGRSVNAHILGEYWLSHVVPHWVEYGMGKNNMRAGLVPPLSGYVDNNYRNSCGCFIRSEVWACLAPGHPEIAARYAYEDAIVDHAGEGVYGEIFCAALQSAAFAESDRDKLVEIGLSYIPAGSAVARCVKEARRCHKAGVDFREARKLINAVAPGAFGVQFTRRQDMKEDGLNIGAVGFDAPENIGIAILAWYYGEGDFGKSLCLAVSCGEDTDCTAATLGALMGIISGAAALPEKWTAPLNDKIETLCIDKTSWALWVPRTVTELAERILRLTPSFLGIHICDILAADGYEINMHAGDGLLAAPQDYLPGAGGHAIDRKMDISELYASPFVVRHEYPAFHVALDYHDEPFFETGKVRKLTVSVTDSGFTKQQQWVNIRLWTPAGVTVDGGSEFFLPMNYNHGSKAEAAFTFTATEEFGGGRLEMILDISLNGRHSAAPIRVVLMRRQE